MPRIQLINADNRLDIKYSKTEGIWAFGDDNAYPQLVKNLISSSVTAKQCVDINAKNIYGKGFQFINKDTAKESLIVNRKGHSLNQLLRNVAKEYSEQNNIFLHLNFNALYEITSVELIPTTDGRIGKYDSTGYSGKYITYDNWDKSKNKKIDKRDFKIIDKFNLNPHIIEKQVEAAGGWAKWKGQILHISSDISAVYSLSDADPVLYDCDSENRAARFKNNGLRQGFFGAKMFVTKPFGDDAERKDFKRTIEDLKGDENSSGVLLLESKTESDDLSKEFIIQNIDTNINDKMFESTENSTARNIRKAFGVPSILLEDSDNSIFGNSGELLVQAKKMHWENKEEERNTIQEAFETIFSKWHAPINITNDWTILPIITQETSTTNE